ncbi:MAG: VOC family protein [Candidatus Marinimicrobia bacterium]|jgi:predicted enzyme related to lactoylglutathione lyase|nr:VOC family protein [FCB group bacterium]MBL7026505.1 VOC family protein [Candidatus Neomarinimicrobiota bacterium]
MSWYKRFDLVWFPVVDFERAKSFYRDDLEFELVLEDQESSWAEFQISPGAKIAIHGVKATNANPIGALVIDVENLEKSELFLRGKGIKLFDKEEIPGLTRLASFTDPDGNVIQLSQSLVE